jgi:hypothetical protein
LAIKPAYPKRADLFSEKIEPIALKFSLLNAPNLEKQGPQIQDGCSFVFSFIWLPRADIPMKASFANAARDYLDVLGAKYKAFTGWCYLKKPEV